MEEVDKFKKLNDTVTYTNKELIGAVHVKMDRIEQRLIDGDKKFVKIETSLKWHKMLILTLYGLIGTFLIKPARSILQKLFGG